MSEAMSGNALPRVIMPVTPLRSIVSESLGPPAPHSPAVAPDSMFELAAVIASRRVHKPSLLFATSKVLLTVIVLPAGGAVAVTVCRRSWLEMLGLPHRNRGDIE